MRTSWFERPYQVTFGHVRHGSREAVDLMDSRASARFSRFLHEKDVTLLNKNPRKCFEGGVAASVLRERQIPRNFPKSRGVRPPTSSLAPLGRES